MKKFLAWILIIIAAIVTSIATYYSDDMKIIVFSSLLFLVLGGIGWAINEVLGINDKSKK